MRRQSDAPAFHSLVSAIRLWRSARNEIKVNKVTFALLVLLPAPVRASQQERGPLLSSTRSSPAKPNSETKSDNKFSAFFRSHNREPEPKQHIAGQNLGRENPTKRPKGIGAVRTPQAETGTNRDWRHSDPALWQPTRPGQSGPRVVNW